MYLLQVGVLQTNSLILERRLAMANYRLLSAYIMVLQKQERRASASMVIHLFARQIWMHWPLTERCSRKPMFCTHSVHRVVVL